MERPVIGLDLGVIASSELAAACGSKRGSVGMLSPGCPRCSPELLPHARILLWPVSLGALLSFKP